MRYALNVAPINGWETHLGSGTAAQALSAAGVGKSVVHPIGSAALALTTSGNGLKAKLGTGSSAMALSASGIGYSMIHGIGAAPQALTATGDGTVIPFMGGQAHLVMSAIGEGKVSPAMLGTALMRVFLADAGRVAVRGSGEAPLVLTGTYGIPTPTAKPSTFAITHKSRQLHVASEPRRIRVEPERTIPARADRRSIGVPATSRSIG